MMRRARWLALAILGGTVGCVTWAEGPAADAAAAVAAGDWPPQVGVASWYGGKFHGRTTSNGETYDMYAHTAAHKTLPFNTRVRVTHLGTGAYTEVRINDRGPFVKDRIIDLSLAAARELDMVRTGTAEVRIEVIQPGDPPPIYLVQVGAFENRANALRLLERLRAAGFAAELETGRNLTRVVIPGLDGAAAVQVQQQLGKKGFPEGLRRTQNR